MLFFTKRDNARLVGKLIITVLLTTVVGLVAIGITGLNTISAAPPPGTGLEATYFNESNLTDPGATRVDPTINFDWGTGPAIPNVIYGNTFSVRWTGHIRAEYTETYTFYTRTDDGVRLWVDGQLLIDQWINQGQAVEWSGNIALTAGRSYNITMEYFENTQRAVAQLSWSSQSTPKVIVPQSVLYTPGTAPPTEDDIDYISESLSISPANPESGQSISFYSDVRNQGTVDAQASSDTVARVDVNNDGSFDVVLSAQFTNPLTAGGSESEIWADAWTAVTGTHRFEVCADANQAVNENNENNNCIEYLFVVSEPPPPPFTDYIIESPGTVPVSPIDSETVSFSASIRNLGNLDATEASETSARLDIGDDGIYDLTFSNYPTVSLLSGSSQVANWDNAWAAVVGTHRIEFCADITDVIDEGEETNNCSTLQFTVSPPPPPPAVDYLAEDLNATAPIMIEGESVSFTATIRNQGNADSLASSETSLRLDVDDDGNYDQTFTNQPTSPLLAGASEAVNWADAWTAVTGTHRFEVCADATSTVEESDDANNCSTHTLTVNVNFPPPPPPGSQIILNNQSWICNGPVDIGLVKVTITTLDKDAVALRNCSGHIGRIEVETATNDGIKGANSPNYWPHDLVVDSGYVRCTGRLEQAHQDAISIMGGNDITFNNFAIECGNMADPFPGGAVSAFSASKGGAGATTPTRIVCDHCVFMSGASNTVVLHDSIESGARNSVVCEDRTAGSGRWSTNANTVNYLNINNEEPPGDDPRCVDFMSAWMWAWSNL